MLIANAATHESRVLRSWHFLSLRRGERWLGEAETEWGTALMIIHAVAATTLLPGPKIRQTSTASANAPHLETTA